MGWTETRAGWFRRRLPLGPGQETATARSRLTAPRPLTLYQYWDTPIPPDEVVERVAGLRAALPGASAVLLNEETAADFVARHCGPREAAAFRACAVPAMQSDYLRLCILDAQGGLYVDADNAAAQPLSAWVDTIPVGMLPIWAGVVGNDTLLVRRPGHPFIRACLQLATENIEHRRFDSVLMVAGPGLFSAMRCAGDAAKEAETSALVAHSSWNADHWREQLDRARQIKLTNPGIDEAIRQLTWTPIQELNTWIMTPATAYKAGKLYWLHWQGSLYR
jgi:hypothetical protein